MSYYLILALILFVYMTLAFALAVIKKRNDLADVAWGLGFVLMAWASYIISGHAGLRGLVVGALVSVWGLRLARHIYARHRGKPEDYRYLAWRKAWGKWFYLRSYLQVYLFQGVLLFAVSAPVFLINHNTGISLSWLDFLGVVVWLIGFYFEAVGDAQLAQFIREPTNKGKLMVSGLWRYSRHPNYFGEVTLWWGIWLIALSVPYGFVSIIGPITITILILKVSGISMLEQQMALKPGWADYKRRTSVFVPWPPSQRK